MMKMSKSKKSTSLQRRGISPRFSLSLSSPARTGSATALVLFVCLTTMILGVSAQEISPYSIDFTPTSFASHSDLFDETCEAVCNITITLNPISTAAKVDVFFLLDDTGSFQKFIPKTREMFQQFIRDFGILAGNYNLEFGFGVGRFEDYGGPGYTFGGFDPYSRPFILNQPILTAADAGGSAQLEEAIGAALNRTAPGRGGDGPEASIVEGLYQVATGVGFDGYGSGTMTGKSGVQRAGALQTQLDPDDSGDVPPFSSLIHGVLSSGTIGGAGFRDDALKLVILATDVCPIATFENGTDIPETFQSAYSTEFTSDLMCWNKTGRLRYGFVGDSYSPENNTVEGAVVPRGAGTIPKALAAVLEKGIRVIGFSSEQGENFVSAGTGPSLSPNVFMSALARLTGAVNEDGDPLVFGIGLDSLQDVEIAIVDSVGQALRSPIDIAVDVSACDALTGLSVSASNAVTNVGPGQSASFDVTFTNAPDGAKVNGRCDLLFIDSSSGLELGSVRVNAKGGPCGAKPPTPAPSTITTFTAAPTPFSDEKVDPPTVVIGQGCQETRPVSVTFPNCSTIEQVDVFLLFDDTGSFESYVPAIVKIFKLIVKRLADFAPCVDFGFGVARFEDYGGSGRTFGGANFDGRPFVLNQPIISTIDAGGQDNLEVIINAALERSAPGSGGDGPESAFEGLFQVATGLGYDATGDGSMLGFNGTQIAGANDTQVASDRSGDVPPFSSLSPNVLSSGSVGGAGFREQALKLVLTATDICSVAPFLSIDDIPEKITSIFSTELTSDLVCSSDLGVNRYGVISDSLDGRLNKAPAGVAPLGAGGTVPETIEALVSEGIRVIGLATNGGSVPPGTGPSYGPNVFLSALSRLTGAIDEDGNALVFKISLSNTEDILSAIGEAVERAILKPIAVELDVASCNTGGLKAVSTGIVRNVHPGGTAAFNVTFTVTPETELSTECSLKFRDFDSSISLGTIPVRIDESPCSSSGNASTNSTSPDTQGEPVPSPTPPLRKTKKPTQK